jgi:hypothetical protein
MGTWRGGLTTKAVDYESNIAGHRGFYTNHSLKCVSQPNHPYLMIIFDELPNDHISDIQALSSWDQIFSALTKLCRYSVKSRCILTSVATAFQVRDLVDADASYPPSELTE